MIKAVIAEREPLSRRSRSLLSSCSSPPAPSPPSAELTSAHRARAGRPEPAFASADVPADYLVWYLGAARTCPGLPWLTCWLVSEAISEVR